MPTSIAEKIAFCENAKFKNRQKIILTLQHKAVQEVLEEANVVSGRKPSGYINAMRRGGKIGFGVLISEHMADMLKKKLSRKLVFSLAKEAYAQYKFEKTLQSLNTFIFFRGVWKRYRGIKPRYENNTFCFF